MYHAKPIMPPPAALVQAVTRRLDPSHPWVPLTGGLTNRLWRVGVHVVKLYDPALATPLFPNDPKAEWAALSRLAPQGLAPHPVDLLAGPHGTALIYRHVGGPTGYGDLPGLARCLHRVHAAPPPPGLRALATGSGAMLAQAHALMADLRGPTDRLRAAGDRLAGLTPVPQVAPVLIHADPVAANVVASQAGPVLIDWQCPALADPCEDLAMVLSPSMHAAYGVTLSDQDRAAFLQAYPDRERVERFRALAPFHHLRMAAYARWSLENGRVSTPDGMELELAALSRAAP